MNALQKKLRINPENTIHLVFSETEMSFDQAVLHQEISTIPSDCQWLMVFVKSVAELNTYAVQVLPKVKNASIIWWAFPKKSSKVKSDLSRDNGWEGLSNHGYRYLNLVSIDENWSAFGTRIEKEGETKKIRQQNNPYSEFINPENREVKLPSDLEDALRIFPDHFSYYNSLAFSHKKEYIVWILSAKKDETRRNRIEKMIEMLGKGQKNPNEKK